MEHGLSFGSTWTPRLSLALHCLHFLGFSMSPTPPVPLLLPTVPVWTLSPNGAAGTSSSQLSASLCFSHNVTPHLSHFLSNAEDLHSASSILGGGEVLPGLHSSAIPLLRDAFPSLPHQLNFLYTITCCLVSRIQQSCNLPDPWLIISLLTMY